MQSQDLSVELLNVQQGLRGIMTACGTLNAVSIAVRFFGHCNSISLHDAWSWTLAGGLL